jgi:hypothetical protein
MRPSANFHGNSIKPDAPHGGPVNSSGRPAKRGQHVARKIAPLATHRA